MKAVEAKVVTNVFVQLPLHHEPLRLSYPLRGKFARSYTIKRPSLLLVADGGRDPWLLLP